MEMSLYSTTQYTMNIHNDIFQNLAVCGKLHETLLPGNNTSV